MLDQLKALALQQLQQKMSGNSLNEQATSEAATEGVSALLQSFQGGDLSQITSLLSGGQDQASNGILQNVQGQLSQILQNKGMSSQEATQEASSTAQDLISGLASKFQSSASEDSAFDLGQLTNLVGGNAGGILNVAKNLFK